MKINLKEIDKEIYPYSKNTTVTHYEILNNEIKIGILDIRSSGNFKGLFVERIILDNEFRGLGYGTAIINKLRTLYPGYLLSGDILYERAYRFWRRFDSNLAKYTGLEPDLYFEFEL